jgi:Ni/Fe-hydrogenase subunit HybB-like protein
MAGFYMMLTKEDEEFLKYWSEQRQKKKPFFGMASVGLRLGVFIAIGIALSLVAATYSRKANPVLENYTSLIITIIIAGLGIVLFITYFTGQHKWDQNELHYQELLRKKEQQDYMQQ